MTSAERIKKVRDKLYFSRGEVIKLGEGEQLFLCNVLDSVIRNIKEADAFLSQYDNKG